jgi:hypothetical protein
LNLYGFGDGDPVTYSDPFGLCPKDAGGDGKTGDYSDCEKGTSGYYAYQDAQGRGGVVNNIRGANAWCSEHLACGATAGVALGIVGGWVAEGITAAAGAVEGETIAVEANKLRHVFGNEGHNLSGLVEHFGSEEATFSAVQRATQAGAKGLSDVFETSVKVAGQNVTVRGRVIDGAVRIGTFFIP